MNTDTTEETQPSVFESTLQKTNVWLNEICERLHWEGDHQKAYQALRAVLHVLRDRLPVEEAAHLGAQLPMLVRGFYYDGWRPAQTPVKVKTVQEFYDAVRENCPANRNLNPLRCTAAVMAVLGAHVSQSEVEKLRAIFPPRLRDLWPTRETSADLSDFD